MVPGLEHLLEGLLGLVLVLTLLESVLLADNAPELNIETVPVKSASGE